MDAVGRVAGTAEALGTTPVDSLGRGVTDIDHFARDVIPGDLSTRGIPGIRKLRELLIQPSSRTPMVLWLAAQNRGDNVKV